MVTILGISDNFREELFRICREDFYAAHLAGGYVTNILQPEEALWPGFFGRDERQRHDYGGWLHEDDYGDGDHRVHGE